MRSHARRRGFSLIELMVVVAIIGMLATAVTIGLVQHMREARRTKVRSDFASLDCAIELFRLKLGRYPQRLEELWIKPANVRDWDPLVNAPPPPVDPWGHPYSYTPPVRGTRFVLTSYGADGTPGGTDEDEDIASDKS